MEILVIDANADTHEELMRCVSEIYPGERIHEFSDPLFGLKHGTNNPVDVLFIRVQTRIPGLGYDIARVLRQTHADMFSVFVTDTPLRRRSDLAMSDAVVELPVTTEKLRQLSAFKA